MSGNGFDEVIFEIDADAIPGEVIEEAERFGQSGSGRSKRFLDNALPTAIVVGTLVLLWWLASALKVWPEYLVPSPATVASRFGEKLASGELTIAVATSLRRVAIGFSIALIAGERSAWRSQHRSFLGEDSEA